MSRMDLLIINVKFRADKMFLQIGRQGDLSKSSNFVCGYNKLYNQNIAYIYVP